MKFIEKAQKLSHKGNHQTPNFRMAAIVVKGGAILSQAANWGYNHAEARACKPHGPCLEGATIYVMRRNGRISKPCAACEAIIKAVGITSVVYVDKNDKIVKERVYG